MFQGKHFVICTDWGEIVKLEVRGLNILSEMNIWFKRFAVGQKAVLTSKTNLTVKGTECRTTVVTFNNLRPPCTNMNSKRLGHFIQIF